MSILNYKEVNIAVEKAMNKTLKDIEVFVDDLTEGVQAEYLFTVNVAKELSTYNDLPGFPYKIRLERKAKNFARECLPKVKRVGSPWKKNSTELLKEIPKNYREGKIDLAVYKDNVTLHFSDYPLCAIELKAFNPQKSKIIADLERNLAFLNLKANTGESVLEFTIFAAFHWCKRISIGEDQKHIENLKQKYEKIFSELSKFTSIKLHEPNIFTLSSSLGVVEHVDEETAEINTSTKHHFSGVIITFSKESSK